MDEPERTIEERLAALERAVDSYDEHLPEAMRELRERINVCMDVLIALPSVIKGINSELIAVRNRSENLTDAFANLLMRVDEVEASNDELKSLHGKNLLYIDEPEASNND
jgi:hypothetical protein